MQRHSPGESDASEAFEGRSPRDRVRIQIESAVKGVLHSLQRGILLESRRLLIRCEPLGPEKPGAAVQIRCIVVEHLNANLRSGNPGLAGGTHKHGA